MLETFLTRPEMEKYMVTYRAGDILCTEGDESQDLFFLVSGKVDIYKGKVQLTQIEDRGASVGEVSALLDGRRTATVKANNSVQVIRIPHRKVSQFLTEFPSLNDHITTLLARRLSDGNQAFFALKEFCNQLPDAVVATRQDGVIIAFNQAAEVLFGRSWDQMRGRSLDEIYETPEVYQHTIDRLQSGKPVKEQVAEVHHPEKGLRQVSTSASFLYDAHHNVAGILNISRDVTVACKSQRQRRRYRWGLGIALLVSFLIAATVFGAYSHLAEQRQVLSENQAVLNQRMDQSFDLIRSLVVDAYLKNDPPHLNQLIPVYHNILNQTSLPLCGIVVLDHAKEIHWAYSLSRQQRLSRIEGSSYAGIPFHACPGSDHKVLTVYHADDICPSGKRGLEIALAIGHGYLQFGWVLFQLDAEALASQYQVDADVLKHFRF